MKKSIILFSLTIFFVLLDYNYTKKFIDKSFIHLQSVPVEPVQGGRDDPYGALEFRYNMLKGRKAYLDPWARIRAINYTKKFLLKKNPKNISTISAWTPIGPGNIGGRIRSILIRPGHPNTLLIGAVSGGVWKSTDGGGSWTPETDDGNPIAIGCMANDGDTVYAGTGEGWENVDAVYGGGIYKSTDFGNTWNLLPSTVSTDPSTALYWDFKNILKLAIDPSGNVYAVTKAYNYKGGVGKYYTNGGLFRSEDGGTTWINIAPYTAYSSSPPPSVWFNSFNGCDVVPITSSTILFAVQSNYAYYNTTLETILGGIWKTTDGGNTWNQVTSGLPTQNYERISFAQNPKNPNSILAAIQSTNNSSPNYGLNGIYKSTDDGNNWSELGTPPIIASTGNLSYLGTQGWYGNVIAIDPFDTSNIYVGGVDIMKSTDGGTNWSQLTAWTSGYGVPVVHADHHAFAFDTTTANVLYDGDDGGIYKTTDGGSSWTDLNNNLAITQFYGGIVYPTGDIFYGGAQDNGQLQYSGTGSNWNEVYGGDGGYSAINRTNSSIDYEEYVYLQINKTTNAGNTWNSATSGLTDAGSSSLCLFIAPFAMDPENSSILIAGSNKIWITTNSAGSWSQSGSFSLSSGELISAVTILDTSSSHLGFFGTTSGRIFKCLNITGSTGDTWVDITPISSNGVQNNGAYVRRIVVDSSNNNNIYVCYSGYNDDGVIPTRHVLHTTDQGTTWSDASGDLPDVPVHSLVIDPDNSQVLYIGTETGVYQTTNGGTNWVNTTTGMPNYVPVDKLVRQAGTDELFAFTHGRSVFETTSPLPVELTNFVSTIKEGKVILNWETVSEINNYGFEVERSLTPTPSQMEGSSSAHLQVVWKAIGFVKGNGNSNAPKYYSFVDNNPVGGSNFNYRIKEIDNKGYFKYSKIINVEILPKTVTLSQNYPNPFNPTTTINYSISQISKVVLKVYDITGSEVAKLVNKIESAGNYSVIFNGSTLASGIYFYKLIANNNSIIKKMILLK